MMTDIPNAGGRLRIHFTADDLARVRVATGPDPMWEAVLSMHQLQTRQATKESATWRRESRRRLGPSARLLLALNPAVGAFPDFLTPTRGATDLETGIDAMLSAPRARLRAGLGLLRTGSATRSWLRAVGDAEPGAMRELGRLFRDYFAKVVTPCWGIVAARVEAERARLAQAFLAGGSASVLTSIGPGARWRPPVLELGYPVDRDLRLDGRDLLIVPSYFCRRYPVTMIDPALPPVLVCPLPAPPAAPPPDAAGADRELSALLGFTRATVLRALETPGSTTELARRAGTSVSSASQHAAVLRQAGLITTAQNGGAVVHTLTALGAGLLRSRAG